jgi:hypothetical protein
VRIRPGTPQVIRLGHGHRTGDSSQVSPCASSVGEAASDRLPDGSELTPASKALPDGTLVKALARAVVSQFEFRLWVECGL